MDDDLKKLKQELYDELGEPTCPEEEAAMIKLLDMLRPPEFCGGEIGWKDAPDASDAGHG